MQRVSSLLPSWDRNRSSASSFSSNHTRKHSIDKVRGWADKIPNGRLSTSSRLGKEALWPATLDKECEKAARIVKSFCSDGFTLPDDRPGSPMTHSSAHSSSTILKKIPPRIIQNAVGLAIFTSMRSGLWTSGSGGSGILIARKTDGTWSPPSGLVLQTASLGFVIGVDIYDCILVINNFTVLEAFARPKLTLGTDVVLSKGPLVSLGLLENDVSWADLSDSAITYIKAKGQFSDAKLEGTVIQERGDENERFYGMKLNVAKILAGDINQSLPQLRPLTEVLKAAEGRVDYDMALVEALSSQPAPSDMLIEPSQTPLLSPAFGLPNTSDPDPFGVVALEMAGMTIREAGSHLRPDSSQFEYHPSPTSPVFPKTKRGSVDTAISRSNRGSYMSTRTVATEKSHVTDAQTQTFPATPETTPSHSQSQSEDGNQAHSSDDPPPAREPIEVDYTKIDISSLRMLSNFPDLEDPLPETQSKASDLSETSEQKDVANEKESSHTPSIAISHENEDKADHKGDMNRSVPNSDDEDMDDDDEEYDFDDEDELDGDDEAVVYEVATAQAPPRMAIAGSQVVQIKGAVVNIPKRVPPPLPMRNAARTSRRRSQMPDVSSMVSSPLRQQFEPSGKSGDVATPRTSQVMEPASPAINNGSEVQDPHKDYDATKHSKEPTSPIMASLDVNIPIVQHEIMLSGKQDTNEPASHIPESQLDMAAGKEVPALVA
ncbi:hypothetical protein F5Y18DRAFT_213482 [Xylariaceae sp. FL1019]|nr:hypothetical protein F5Y18DRAFT_213482 [Xylariaceae sp. FL1019]